MSIVEKVKSSIDEKENTEKKAEESKENNESIENNIVYATDLDRTVIFSRRFIDEHHKETDMTETTDNIKTTDSANTILYHCVEYKDDKKISYMSDKVAKHLKNLNGIQNDKDSQLRIIPVTSRSLEEYNRVKLGFIPEYAVVANGGIILHNGEIDTAWQDYIKRNFNYMEALEIIRELEDETESIETAVKVIDNVYLFCKTTQHTLFDQEVLYFMSKYTNWEFTRQGNKVYIVPKHFSKQVALRYLWHKLNCPYIVASGDGLMDLGMLTLANKAIIPSHSELWDLGYIVDGAKADGGIESPLYTIGIVNSLLEQWK